MGIAYTKLKDGSWGIRAEGTTVTTGSTVTVTKKSGESKRETVGKVLWTGNGVILATIAGSSSPVSISSRRGSSSFGGRSSHYCGYPCPVTGRKCCAANGPCHDCE